ncbi:hypothetical protein AWW66_09920 [Micromonospora rosaria]|uniref:YbaB/EbfC DNA-binding family protein n=1 Tax=Micromonospora rosaria TaxID=47874 RepID=A0A136PVE6_9ACTN|nr:hypothetical protein [Micromonospora rosaria]KXK62146.1 hypothetical protein AWW66_09920 [Micromonospora rosaria]
MSDEVVEKLRRLHQQTTELAALLASVQSQPPPGRTAGTDARGAAEVSIGAEGLPIAIEVAPDWQRRVEPRDLGSAVLSAFEDAIAEGQRAWAAGFDSDAWAAEADRFKARSDRQHTDEPLAPLPQVPVYGPGRDHLALNEEILTTFQAVRAQSATPPEPAMGRNRERTVSIALSTDGLRGCEIEPAWAATRTAREINAELSQALHGAHAILRERSAHQRREAENLEGLAQEALATLVRLADASPRPQER